MQKEREIKMEKTYRVLGKRGRITVPYEIRQAVGFEQNDILSFETTENGRAVLVRRERICDCTKAEGKVVSEEMTLYDFLNGLTPAQQQAAIVHLSMKWAEAQGKKNAD